MPEINGYIGVRGEARLRSVVILGSLFVVALSFFVYVRGDSPKSILLPETAKEMAGMAQTDKSEMNAVSNQSKVVIHHATPEAVESPLPETDLRVQLVSIRENEKILSATLWLEQEGRKKSFQAGDEIYPLVMIHEIFPDSVVINNHGKKTRLQLDVSEWVNRESEEGIAPLNDSEASNGSEVFTEQVVENLPLIEKNGYSETLPPEMSSRRNYTAEAPPIPDDSGIVTELEVTGTDVSPLEVQKEESSGIGQEALRLIEEAKRMGQVAQKNEVTDEGREMLKGIDEAMPEGGEAIPKGGEAILKGGEAMPNGAEAMPGGNEVMLRDSETIRLHQAA